MTFQDIIPEITKGRKFRKKGEILWIQLNESVASLVIHTKDLNSNDWELEPPAPKELNLRNLVTAWERVSPIRSNQSMLFRHLVKELGFEYPG